MKKALFLMNLLSVSALLVVIASSSQAESNTIRIIIGDLYFKPETVQLKAGQEVKIELVNEGKIEHEFMVGRVVKMEEGKDETHEGRHEANEEK
ncbi:MAG: cupredoxin domain-containing protein [Deltaproteobacteria bacterium]|nr:cupredoxin domain-containing protein [Deltaproteobacteria bacterium]